MKSRPLQNQGFTLIEIITVLIILSLIVTAAIANYRKAVERQSCAKAKMDLMVIHSAERIYRAKSTQPNRFTTPINTTNIAAINATLKLNLTEPRGFSYSFISSGASFEAEAAFMGMPVGASAVYTLRIEDTIPDPFCQQGTCSCL